MIEKLQYVVHNRPYIGLAVGIVARFSTNPRENHLMVVKSVGVNTYLLFTLT